ncbi:hypothetical protein [Leisingera thetidis]|uniref:hypothetical protein n=1 Tax=Leisingera thetidis TaxID=2930199 RepID=UPI0021F763EF|nr:hypothetical protein [Leisingera thetidis]
MAETLLSFSEVLLFGRLVEDLKIKKANRKGRLGANGFLARQLADKKDPRFARIYGFAYEGAFYQLPEPLILLVHGEGEKSFNECGGQAIAPMDPSKSGVAAADFQMSADVMYWEYDKADFTIRMDLMTGMFEQVLLDVFFAGGPGVSGAKVSGAKVSGAKVSGAKVSGAKVSGAKARGSGD